MKFKKNEAFSLFEKVKGTAGRLLYILKLVWDTSRFLLFGMVLISVLEGIFPLLNVYISSRLINALIAVFGSRDWSLMQPVFSLLILQFLYLLFSRAATQFKTTLTNLSGEMVISHIKVKIAKKTKEIDLADFDRPEFFEKLENANREASTRPISILTSTLNLFSNLISTVSFIITLGALHPLIPIVLLLLALPSAIINFKYIKEHTTERRRMHYFTNTLSNRDQVKEIKLLGLHDTFIARYLSVFTDYFKGLRRIFIREDVLHVIVHALSTACSCAFFFYIASRVCLVTPFNS